MKYGELPVSLGIHTVECREMMFYQYLPIKMCGLVERKLEPRLRCFSDLIIKIEEDFVKEFGFIQYLDSYIYLTVKR